MPAKRDEPGPGRAKEPTRNAGSVPRGLRYPAHYLVFMPGLQPVAFDIETTGLDPGDVISVVGLAGDGGAWLGLNTAGRDAPRSILEQDLARTSGMGVSLTVTDDEGSLLRALGRTVDERIDGDRQYLTAFNGEVWRGGFDLPFLRRACVRRAVDWPFAGLAYADQRTVLDRIATGDTTGLAGTYAALIGGDGGDPFEDSTEAVRAFEEGNWLALLRHNLADVERTRELAVLAGRYVPRSDFGMKNLAPPDA